MTTANLVKGNARPLGFFDGVRCMFSGVRWVLGTPSVWGLAAVPVIIAFVLIVGITWGGYELGSRFVEQNISTGSVTSSILHAIASVLVFVLALIIGFVLGFSLAQPLSAPALDALAKRRAVTLGVNRFVDSSPLAAMARSLRVVTVALVLALPVLIGLSLLTLIFPVIAVVTLPAKFAVAAWLATWDVFDYAFGLESMGVRARFTWLANHGAAAFAFGLALAGVALIPGLGLLILPMGVAGSTELWVRARQAAASG